MNKNKVVNFFGAITSRTSRAHHINSQFKENNDFLHVPTYKRGTQQIIVERNYLEVLKDKYKNQR